MTTNQTNNSVIEDFDEFDQTNPDAKRGMGSLIPRLVFVNAHPDYDGTAIAGGGFMLVTGDNVKRPDGWGEEITLKDGKTAWVSPSIECAVLAISPQTRRYIVEVDVEGKSQPIGHIDIASKFFRENIANTGDYLDGHGKPAKSRISMFVVLKCQPDQPYELGLKSGNANVARAIGDLLGELAAMQTERLGQLRGKPYLNTLMSFINWTTLTAGTRLDYSARDPNVDAGGFSRISIAWPGVEKLKIWQRQFINKTQFGDQIDQWKEWHAAKKLITDDDLYAMNVGLGNYGVFREKRETLDTLMANGYIRPLESFEAINEAIDLVKQRYFERSIAINSRQLPPAQQGSTPVSRDDYEDKKHEAAAKPANGKPTPTEPVKFELLPPAELRVIAKKAIVNWHRIGEADRAATVADAEAQYVARMDEPFVWGTVERDGAGVAQLLQICANLDEVNQVSY